MNGCYNRKPLKDYIVVQDGWQYQGDTRHPIMDEVLVEMTKDCQYSKTTQDAKCDGCRWNQGGKEDANR